MEKTMVRVMKEGRAKDYQRNAKYFPYYYVIINKKSVLLKLGGWSEGEPVLQDEGGQYIEYCENKYYLK